MQWLNKFTWIAFFAALSASARPSLPSREHHIEHEGLHSEASQKLKEQFTHASATKPAAATYDAQTLLFKKFARQAQSQYAGAMVKLFKSLMTLNTVHVRDANGNYADQSKNPDIIKVGQIIGDFAKKNGLDFYNPVGKSSGKDNQVFIVSLKGTDDTAPLAFYMHSDVVPVDPSQWGLQDADGKFTEHFNPFRATFKRQNQLGQDAARASLVKQQKELEDKIAKTADPDELANLKANLLDVIKQINHISGSRYYGRGAIDDKAAIASSLYALKAIKDLQMKGKVAQLKRSIYLIIETTEETTYEGVANYKEWAADRGIDLSKQISVGLDAFYPATVGEKGNGRVNLNFPLMQVTPGEKQVVVSSLHGAQTIDQQAENLIPAVAKIHFKGDIDGLQSLLQDKSSGATLLENYETWLKQQYDSAAVKDIYMPAAVAMEKSGDELILSFHGREHASYVPSDASNALVKAYAFLRFYKSQGALSVAIVDNHFSKMAAYFWDVVGLDYSGRKLGINYIDPFDANGNATANVHESLMGEISVLPTYLNTDANNAYQVLDIRAPRGSEGSTASQLADTATRVQTNLQARLDNDGKTYGFTAVYNYQDAPRYVNPTQPWLAGLLDTFKTVTGKTQFQPMSIGGTTTASYDLGGINFGPTMPDEIDVYHVANEFKKTKNLAMDLRMFTEGFMRTAEQ